MFLERLRERAEQRARQQLQEEVLLRQQQENLPNILFNDGPATIHSGSYSVGIGGGGSISDNGYLNSSTAHLFMARAPPPYSPREETSPPTNESNENNDPASSRSDQPPSYDSIFS